MFRKMVLLALVIATPSWTAVSAAPPAATVDAGGAEAEPQVHAYFATMIGTALDKAIEADALDQGVPVALVELIATRYPQPNNRDPLLASYRGCAVSFDERWRAYTERRAVVDQAVTEATKLKAGEQDAEAMAALEAVITAVDAPETDHLGRMAPMKRDFLEVRDAELPAVTALGVLAAEQRMAERLPQLRVAFLARRRVSSSEASERIAWLATHCGENVRKSQGRFYGFSVGQKGEATQAVEKVLDYAGRAQTDGASLANGFFSSLPEHGLTVVELGAKPDLVAGQWVMLEVAPTKVTKNSVAYKKLDQWREAYDCGRSDEIDGIDPQTGRFHYKLECKTRAKSQLITLTARVADTSALKKDGATGYPKVWVLGKVKSVGPKWVLTDARIIELPAGTDLRFLSR